MKRRSRPAGRPKVAWITTASLMLLLSTATGGCTLFRPEPADEPPPVDEAGTEDDETEGDASLERAFPEPVLSENLEADALLALGDGRLADGDLAGAAETYLQLVDTHPQSDQAAQALFQLAALQLNPSSPIYDTRDAVATLERIGLDHPESPWAPAATLLLELTRQNADLEQTLHVLEAQLDELKRLDLSSDPSDG